MTASAACRAALRACPCMKMKAGICCTSAVSGGWRNGANNLASATYTGNTVTLAARPELRDDDPAGARQRPGPSERQQQPDDQHRRHRVRQRISDGPGNGLYIRGPFSFQAEYGWNLAEQCIGHHSGTSTPAAPKLTTPTDYMFNGGYVQVAYTLTGENRAYDKRWHSVPVILSATGTVRKAYIVRDEDGGMCSGWGAGKLPPATRIRTSTPALGATASRAASWTASASP